MQLYISSELEKRDHPHSSGIIAPKVIPEDSQMKFVSNISRNQ